MGKPESSYLQKKRMYTDVDEILTRNLVQPSELNTAARDSALRGSVDYYTLFAAYR